MRKNVAYKTCYQPIKKALLKSVMNSAGLILFVSVPKAYHAFRGQMGVSNMKNPLFAGFSARSNYSHSMVLMGLGLSS